RRSDIKMPMRDRRRAGQEFEARTGLFFGDKVGDFAKRRRMSRGSIEDAFAPLPDAMVDQPAQVSDVQVVAFFFAMAEKFYQLFILGGSDKAIGSIAVLSVISPEEQCGADAHQGSFRFLYCLTQHQLPGQMHDAVKTRGIAR